MTVFQSDILWLSIHGNQSSHPPSESPKPELSRDCKIFLTDPPPKREKLGKTENFDTHFFEKKIFFWSSRHQQKFSFGWK